MDIIFSIIAGGVFLLILVALLHEYIAKPDIRSTYHVIFGGLLALIIVGALFKDCFGK